MCIRDSHIVPGQVLEVNTMDILIEFAKIGLGIGCVIREFVQEAVSYTHLYFSTTGISDRSSV